MPTAQQRRSQRRNALGGLQVPKSFSSPRTSMNMSMDDFGWYVQQPEDVQNAVDGMMRSNLGRRAPTQSSFDMTPLLNNYPGMTIPRASALAPQVSQSQDSPPASAFNATLGLSPIPSPAEPALKPPGIFEGMVAAPTGGSSLNMPRFTPGTTQSAYRPLQSLQPRIDASRERTRINGEMLRNQARQQIGPLAPVANTEMIPGDPMAPENVAFRQGRQVPDITGFGTKARVSSGGLLYGLTPGAAAREARGVQPVGSQFNDQELANRMVARNNYTAPVWNSQTDDLQGMRGAINEATGMAMVNRNSPEQARLRSYDAIRNRKISDTQLGNLMSRQQELESRASNVKLRGLARGYERRGATPIEALAMAQASMNGAGNANIANAGMEARAGMGDPNAIRGLGAANERALNNARADALGAEAKKNLSYVDKNRADSQAMRDMINYKREVAGLAPLGADGQPVVPEADATATPEPQGNIFNRAYNYYTAPNMPYTGAEDWMKDPLAALNKPLNWAANQYYQHQLNNQVASGEISQEAANRVMQHYQNNPMIGLNRLDVVGGVQGAADWLRSTGRDRIGGSRQDMQARAARAADPQGYARRQSADWLLANGKITTQEYQQLISGM